MDRYGYWNKILHLSLGDRRTWVQEPGDHFFRRYAGGRGLIAHYLLEHVPRGADPLGPDNILIFAPGVITGAPVPGAGRHSVGAKSPLTGAFGESESGGYWGDELKRAGWDAIIVHGVSPTPVYLWITLARLFNLREGFGRDDDRLPPRFSDPLPKHAGLSREQQDEIVTDYYVEQGWDPATGVPTAETIRALEIEADAAHAV